MRYSATELAKKLDISRSYLYHLRNTASIVAETSAGKIIWDDNVYNQVKAIIEKNKPIKKMVLPKEELKTIKINNRRYLGNKYKLLSFITSIVKNECENINTVADIFSGTGSVASAFLDKKVITNDNLYSNYICHIAWFSPETYSKKKISNIIDSYNKLVVIEDNYMSDNFADTYFSLEDCRKIGYIREDIEILFSKGEINKKERALLITSLLYAMDKIANTCGHYDAYRKVKEYDKHLELCVPIPEESLNANNLCFNMDANELVKEVEADLVYIDPPYNSRQYCDAYHLLENVAKWEKPNVYGVAKKMDRTALKSDYCTKSATKAFEELINSINARYILLSYNNMAQKGNDRSNAKISDEDIIRILEKKGSVQIFSEEHKAFSTGKSNIQENEERLFLCKCYDSKKEAVASALNYTGGKFKLLPQLFPLFPQNIDKAVDLFCGGCNVGINLDCNKVMFNDSNKLLIGLINTFARMEKKEIFEEINRVIEKYNLSKTCEYGYEYYGCKSSEGVSRYNKKGFNRLRDDFNKKAIEDNKYYIYLYVLIVYAFNNQMRFNKKGEYNLPVGKRDFNKKMQKKLETFIDRIKSGDYIFQSNDFRAISTEGYTKDSFFYVDPPYLITCATYNEQGGWAEKDEYDLLNYLDRLDKKGIRFALSNVIRSKGKTNYILQAWLEKNTEKYKVIFLDYNYNNSNYQTKDRNSKTEEVLIINY